MFSMADSILAMFCRQSACGRPVVADCAAMKSAGDWSRPPTGSAAVMKQRGRLAEHAEDLLDRQILQGRPGIPQQVARDQTRIGDAQPRDRLARGVVAQFERFLARVGPAVAEDGNFKHHALS